MITLDNGVDASYDHEAAEHLNHEDGTATLVCACGDWSGEGTFDAETWEVVGEVVIFIWIVMRPSIRTGSLRPVY